MGASVTGVQCGQRPAPASPAAAPGVHNRVQPRHPDPPRHPSVPTPSVSGMVVVGHDGEDTARVEAVPLILY